MPLTHEHAKNPKQQGICPKKSNEESRMLDNFTSPSNRVFHERCRSIPPLSIKNPSIVAQNVQDFRAARAHAPNTLDWFGDGHPVKTPNVKEAQYHSHQPG
jgi:hypothetical protein